MNINALKNLQVRDGAVLDELVAARAELKILASNYDDLGVSIPDWIVEKLDQIEPEIKSQVKAELQATLKKLISSRSALRTADEKRADLDVQIQKLQDLIK